MPKINKTLIERTKSAIIFAAVVFGIGYYYGGHNARVNAQQAVPSAVHQPMSKQ